MNNTHHTWYDTSCVKSVILLHFCQIGPHQFLSDWTPPASLSGRCHLHFTLCLSFWEIRSWCVHAKTSFLNEVRECKRYLHCMNARSTQYKAFFQLNISTKMQNMLGSAPKTRVDQVTRATGALFSMESWYL